MYREDDRMMKWRSENDVLRWSRVMGEVWSVILGAFFYRECIRCVWFSIGRSGFYDDE